MQDKSLSAEIKKLNERMAHMERVRAPWWQAWRELSDFFLPRRYPWLLTDKEVRSASVRNRQLLDSTSITALRTLATGLMNGITSPARPWFRLRIPGFIDDNMTHEVEVWLEEVARRMLIIMAESNFYSALGIYYSELATFGTASMDIREDPFDVIRCTNHALGEFFIDTDENGRVNRHARKFARSVEQTVSMFGEANVSPTVLADFKAGGVRLSNQVYIYHMVEPNDPPAAGMRKSRWRETYWEAGKQADKALLRRPLDEMAPIVTRWETYGTDVYGSSPCMDALPDVRQLQQMIKQRAIGLEKQVNPPVLVNRKLAGQAKSLLPGGQTFVSGNELGEGMRPVYQINIPFQELNADIASCQARIRQVLFNDLFRMISELETVRSATEIDARREEKLVLLGPVLERFESEALSPMIDRIYNICDRAGLFPPAPEAIAGADLQVQYVSILADAQRAVGTVAIERYLQLLGNMAAIFPEALDVPNPEEIARDYAEAIGVKKKLNRSRDESAQIRAARSEQQQISEAAVQGQALVGGAQQLSQTDVGGGQNALQALLG